MAMPTVQTEILPINASQPEERVLAHAAALLRACELVVFPTETVYGLGAAALQPAAVEKIFAAKERPYSDPLIVHIASEADIEHLVCDISEQARQVMRHFWPGPLTLVLPAHSRVPRLVTSGLDTVAVRMPSHPVALGLIRTLGAPVAAPSANRFMHVSPTTAQHVEADLKGRVPLILDGGASAVGVESTILDMSSELPTILRPGGVSLEALRVLLPQVQPPRARSLATPDLAHETEAQKSPGQMLIHYAPRVPAFLFDGLSMSMRHAMLLELQRRQRQGETVGVLIADEDVAYFQSSGASMYVLGSEEDATKVASRLFAGLRTLEDVGVDVILCRAFPETGLGLAIRDRLLKATGGKLIPC